MPDKKHSREQLVKEYGLDDERLEIVCCWHQLYDDIEGARFDRYPSLDHPDHPGEHVTPDFLVEFDGKDYRLIGEICRLPAHDGGFADQLRQPLIYARIGDEVDVMFLTHYSFAHKNERRALEEGLITQDGEQVIWVSYTRDTLADAQWWLFKRASTIRSVDFRDEFVGEWSLRRRMTDTLDDVHVPSRRWGRYKSLFPICNDAPYPIYMASLLWDRVFPKMVSSEEYEEVSAKGAVPLFDIIATDEAIRDKARELLRSERIRKSWIQGALELLKDAGRAEKRGGEWIISYGQWKAPRADIRDFHLKLIYKLAPDDFEDDGAPTVPPQASLFDD